MISTESVIEEIKNSGYRVTMQRKAIIHVLVVADRPLPASTLLTRVRRVVGNVSPDTLYRNLDLLLRIGAVNRIKVRGGDLFELNRWAHHHHLICLDCGRITCLEDCPLQDEVAEYAKGYQFEAVRHVFDVYGYCNECKGKRRS